MLFRENQVKYNDGWRFRFQTDDNWTDVTLPHTWNALDTMSTDPDWHYRRGVGIYEKDFDVPDDFDFNNYVWLEFEAVSQRCKVYFDDELIAEHHGGYTAFRVQIPQELGYYGTLRIEVDNTPDPDLIPSDMSDFFLYGGITRNVWWYETGECWIESMQCDIDCTDTYADVTVNFLFAGKHYLIQQFSVNISGIDFSHDINCHVDDDLSTDLSEFYSYSIKMPRIEGRDFQRWSPDNPQLYRVSALALYPHDSPVLDDVSDTIGFRTFEFPEYGAFYLNGERLLLRGTHRHEDWAGYGGAVPDEITRKEFQLMKDAGFNFVRLGHYPQSREALNACDELGIIVWEEIPWCRGGIGGETFKTHTRNMLIEMIDQHRNHPSIIFWGLGNELDWESEHLDSTDDKVVAFLQELHDLTHELDDTRLTALRRFDYGAHVVDVYSPSIWAGWYRGKYTDYETNIRNAMKKFPRLLHAEWGGDSHAGRFRESPHITQEPPSTVDNAEEVGTATSSEGFTRYSKDGDWSESYIVNLMDHHLEVHNRLENFAGSLQWAFKDFGTPLRPENPVPYVNQKGLITRDGTPKACYYVFQKWQTNLMTPAFSPENIIMTSTVNTYFTTIIDDNILYITLFDDDGNTSITDERRVQFTCLSGGQLLRYQGHMGGSDVVETANGKAWIRLLPEEQPGSMIVRVEVDGMAIQDISVAM